MQFRPFFSYANVRFVTPLFPLLARMTYLAPGYLQGQRIVARLRERAYEAALKQEVEFIEKGEGDVLSRLSVDSSIVGERWAECLFPNTTISTILAA